MDFATVTQRLTTLLPTGGAWVKAAGTNLYQSVALLAPSISRLYGDIDNRKSECFPVTTNTNLDQWQASVGLPDPAYTGILTHNQQRAQMVARISAIGGQTIAYYVRYAAALGYTIRITELAVPRAGLSKAGQSQSNGVGADHVWVIDVVSGKRTVFRAGDRDGNRLASYPDLSLLIHEFDRIKPAHTLVEYNTVTS